MKTNASGHGPLRLSCGWWLAFIIFATLPSTTDGVFANDATHPFLLQAGPAKPTRAWLRFCNSAPSECTVNAEEPPVIRYSYKFWSDVLRVNIEVNYSVEAVTDQVHWGISDRWDYPVDGKGDCEDFQLEKRRQLVTLGYPARALRMAVVINAEGEGHAVLVVRTGHGDFVLDNRIDEILLWNETKYNWVKREGDLGADWVSLGEPNLSVETAGDAK